MPYFGSTLFVATIAVLVVCSLAALALLSAALFGARVEAAAEALAARPNRSVLVGLPAGVIVLFVGGALLQGGGGAKLVGALLLAGFMTLSSAALATVGRVVGQRLAVDKAAPVSARTLLSGVLVVEIASLMPFFGWLVVLPLSLAAGWGALVRTSLRRASKPVAAPATLHGYPTWDVSHAPR